MGFLEGLFGRNKKNIYTNTESETQNSTGELDEQAFMEEHQFSNALLREKYIYHMIERMKEAADESDILNREYDTITQHLTDMEEVERLPEHLMQPLKDVAGKIVRLEAEHRGYSSGATHMTEADFALGQRIESEMPECYDKLIAAERLYQDIKSDLNRMEGEKQAYYYRRTELTGMLSNVKGIIFIILIAFISCILLLAVMQFGFEMDTMLGYLITFLFVAVSLTILFVRNMDIRREARVVEKTICKLIHMHNTIKIRYVNQSGLLDYYYMKYEVNSAKEMKSLWEKYLKEKEERERYEKTKSDIIYFRKDMLRQLQALPIASPKIWLYQAEALVNHNEMVEIRHGLIERRRNLREQLAYNKNVAYEAKSKLEHMAQCYPQYSAEVLAQLEIFEKRII